ncbi:MAG: hypothetical protein K9J83_00570 [Desulfarculaceae bacterium]|nr:hypothetical protein [Desulfarculaceae bacterium]
MNKFTGIGLIAWAGALVLLLFQGVSLFMNQEGWQNLTMSDLTGNAVDAVITKIPVEAVITGLNFLLIEIAAYQFLFGFGLLCLIIGAFSKM